MMSIFKPTPWAVAMLATLASVHASRAQDTTPTPAAAAPSAAAEVERIRALGVVTVVGSGQPTALPTQIPATWEGVTREQLARSVNASDSEDALKYLPSLLVRKRYIGDYNHAVLSSRASGTGNSARSAVYADGILLSNYLGNGVGGLSFPPRWGMVTPSEMERVDVMYGPFSAAFPGNSVGAVVVFTTRLPKAFEAHAQVGYTTQQFDLYNTHGRFNAWETSVSLGDKAGALSWLLSASHATSHGQPLTFVTRLLSTGIAGTTGTPVTGAVLDANNANSPWLVLGTGTQYRSEQDHLKLRLGYDLTPQIQAHYLLGLWHNRSQGQSQSYLRSTSGQPVSSGVVNINGQSFAALTGADFATTRESLAHGMQALSLKSHARPGAPGQVWDWSMDLSRYDYQRDQKRQSAANNPLPSALEGGAGSLADGAGTGWTNVALKATWRPGLNVGTRVGSQPNSAASSGPPNPHSGADSKAAVGTGLGSHVVDLGLQQDRYVLRYLNSNIAGNWITDAPTSLASDVGGRTQLDSAFVQDTWNLASAWKAVLGLRAERWQALQGHTAFTANSAIDHAARSENHLSPKLALAWQAAPDWVLKTAAGRALRFPTVAELYGATATTNSQFINDPLLRPERSWTGELSAEKDWDSSLLRLTLFAENTHDALYSQTLLDPLANRNISRVQNVGRIQTRGVEVAYNGSDVGLRGLEFSASATFADSVIKENQGFVVTAGDTLGKRQPNVPRWRATAVVGYRWSQMWTSSLALRYSGVQYRSLNNADVNGNTYQGVSPFLGADVRLRAQLAPGWTAALGVDNLNNDRYWNFHPYPQRSVRAEIKFDL